jgi:hypothetical protein
MTSCGQMPKLDAQKSASLAVVDNRLYLLGGVRKDGSSVHYFGQMKLW